MSAGAGGAPRPYRPGRDRTACMALFDGNLVGPDRPRGAFRPEERPAFLAFLDDPPGPFRLLERGGRVVACGGWAREAEPGLHSLCWTVVAAEEQGTGLGRLLVQALVAEVRAAAAGGVGDPPRLRLDTIPGTRGFFERLGFRAVTVEPGGYGPGMPPRVEMERRL